ncbi:glycosyltransferase family 2 protein [bacterium]|nr:glycosyltransferase family 2 protein [bacterium]MCK4597200.1 glycosyltransferase family 2 protein [bacterium]
MDISVVIPVSGHSGDLGEIYARFSRELREIGRSYEFIFIDDGAGGEISQTMKGLQERHSSVKVIKFNRTFGEAVALSVGFEKARGEIIITLASFMQVDPRDLHKLLDEIDAGCDLIIGWRYPRVDPVLNRWQSQVFNWITRRLTTVSLHDVNCSLRVIRRKVVEAIPIYGDQFRFLPILAHRQGFRVKEIKVRHVEEMGQTGIYGLGSYVRRLIDILTLFFLVKFTKKPLRFFGLIGSALFGIGFMINLYLTVIRLMGNRIGDRPLLLLGVLLIVLGIQTISIGLVGEIIIFTHAKEIKEYNIEQFLE